MAPLNSPLIPVVAASRVMERKNSSPVPPMSPETFKLFETLNQTFSSIDFGHNETNEDKNNNDRGTKTVEIKMSINDEVQIKDYSYVPESDDDSDNGIDRVSVQTHAIHNSEHQKAKPRSEISNTICNSSTGHDELDVDSNDGCNGIFLKKNDGKSMERIEIEELNNDYRNKTNEDQDLKDCSYDTDSDCLLDNEKGLDNVSDSILRNDETVDEIIDLGMQVSNNDNRNKTNEDEDLRDCSCDTDPDYVPDNEKEIDNDSDGILRKDETEDEIIDLENSNQNE